MLISKDFIILLIDRILSPFLNFDTDIIRKVRLCGKFDCSKK